MNCPLCSSTDVEFLPELTRVARSPLAERIVRCTSCGLARLDPMPSEERLQEFYSSGQFADFYQPDDYMAGHVTAAQYIVDRIAGLEQLLGKAGRILDIGAAHGAFLAAARDRGWQISGVELDVAAAELARQSHGIDLKTTTLENAGFAKGSFDAVHMSHVLEHLLSPVSTLKLVHDLLDDRGVLFVEIPHEFGDLYLKARRTLLRRPIPPYPVPTPHTFFFTPATLRRLAEKTGFQVVSIRTPRRNRNVESALPLGRLAKRAVYALEEPLQQGPLLELIARKS